MRRSTASQLWASTTRRVEPSRSRRLRSCSGGSTGAHLINHDDVDFVILTGGTETGMEMLRQKPDLHLSAETGGKNATIVTAMADRDQAIKNIIYSAFGNSGQKCSATSLLVLEEEVYDDPVFRRQLRDAAASAVPLIPKSPSKTSSPRMAPAMAPNVFQP